MGVAAQASVGGGRRVKPIKPTIPLSENLLLFFDGVALLVPEGAQHFETGMDLADTNADANLG